MQVGCNDDDVCMMSGCTQVDLLLSRCGDCGKRYCQTHSAYEAHKCMNHRDAAVIRCPLCNRVVPCTPQEDANLVVSQHIDRGCRDIPVSSSSNNDQQHRLNFCSFHACRKNELTLIVCDKCGNSYCVDHRMPSRHECKAEVNPRTPPRVSPTARRSPSKNIMAPRNTFDTPLGSYSGDEPVVVSVVFPTEFQVRPFYFRGGTKVVMGRILDQICLAADVPNVNNSSVHDQWRVFALRKDSSPTSVSLSSTLGSVVASSGGSVVVVLCKQDTIPEAVVRDLKAAVADGKHTGQSGHGCLLM